MKISSVGQLNGMGAFVPETANVDVEDFNRIPGDLSGLDQIEDMENEAVMYGNIGLGQSIATTMAAASNMVRSAGVDPKVMARLRTMSDNEIRAIHDALVKGQGYKDMFHREVKAVAGSINAEYMRRFGPMARAAVLMKGAPSSKPANVGLMEAVIKTAQDVRATVQTANAKKIAALAKNPLLAANFVDSAKRKTLPGTNTQTAIIKAFYDAEKFAKQALGFRQIAEKALARGNKKDAAAALIKSMEMTKKAGDLAYRAEKTKLANASDRIAKVAQAQAGVFAQAADKLMMQRGPNPQSDMLRAKSQELAAKAATMSRASAVVAAQPATLPGLPTPRRIAEVANKYNLRSAGINGNAAVLATLNGYADDALAQATDYEGVMMYYGNDMAGKLMADVEFGNLGGLIAGLDELNGLGNPFGDFMNMIGGAVKGASDVVSNVTKAVQGGVKAVQDGYKSVADAAKKVGITLPGTAKPPTVAATSSAVSTAFKKAASPATPVVRPAAPVSRPVVRPAAPVSRPVVRPAPSSAATSSRPAAPAASASAPIVPTMDTSMMMPPKASGGGMPIALIAGVGAVVVIGGFLLLKK